MIHPAVHRAFPVLLIGALGSLVFANALGNGFHLDDFYRIVDNPEIRHVMPVWRHFGDPATISGSQGVSETPLHQLAQYRPLLPLTLSLSYAVAGHNLVVYHLGNLFLHFLAAILVYFLVLELLRYRSNPSGGECWPGEKERRLLALIVAAAFAIHPVSGIPVNYVLARDLLLMELFLMASLLAYLRMRRVKATPWRWAGALTLLVLALLSKSTAAIAPLVVLLFEVTVGGERLWSWTPWRRAAPFAVAVAAFYASAYLLLDFSFLARIQSGEGPPFWRYPLTQAEVHLFHYLANFFWPFPIRMAAWVEPARGLWEPRVMAGLAVVGTTIWAGWAVRRSAPLFSFSVLAYWVLMAPESSLLALHHPAVHYRPYPASPFFFLVLGLIVVRVLRPRAALAVGILAVAWFGTASAALNRTWRTEESLWTHSIRYGAEPLAHMNLAMSIADRRDPRIRHHLEEALRRSPGYILAHINVGLLELEEGEAERGLERIRRAIEMDPSQGQSHYWLSVAYTRLGREKEAAAASARAGRLDPRNIRLLYKAALDASRIGDHHAALEWADRVERIDSDYEETGFLKGYAFQMLGRLDDAAKAYREFLAAHPEHGQVHFNLAHALMSSGRCDAAVPHFEKTLRLRPDYDEARRNLSACRDKGRGGPPDEEIDLASRYRAAFEAYEVGNYAHSLELVGVVEAIRPEYEETLFLKGYDLQMLGRLDEAIAAYRRFLSRHPAHAQVQFNLGHALMSAGQCDMAIPHFERGLALARNRTSAHTYLATCYEAVGDPSAAERHRHLAGG